jgi:hypothetical protein
MPSTKMPPASSGAAAGVNGGRGDLAHRHPLVEESLLQNKPIYYFGLGSNMSRSFLESRSFDGKKIHVISMEPAYVRDYRLAFNLPASLPLEPAMGSLERCQPTETDPNPSRPLYPYDKPECHGALIQLSSEDYERVMVTESVSGTDVKVRNYREEVVTAIPYDKSHPPVDAVVLSAYPHVRLPQDVAPSERYMQILRDGARELQLEGSYQAFLDGHPIQIVPEWLTKISAPNFVLILQLYFTRTALSRKLVRMQFDLLYSVYACPTSPRLKQLASQICQAFLLLPGSLVGLGLIAYRQLTGTKHPPATQHFLDKMNAHWSRKSKASA